MKTTLLERKIPVIQKETIPSVSFAKYDVLMDPAKKRLRDIYLCKAERLGNGYRGKVKIVFETEEGYNMAVVTTIWAANREHICLKGGITIPVTSIVDIEF